MQELSLTELDKQQAETIEQFILMLADKGFNRTDFDWRRYQMDLAIKQQYMDQGIESGDYVDYNLNNETVNRLYNQETNDEGSDVYSDLYLPYMLKYSRAYRIHMANLCFPANGDWLNITRSFSSTFYTAGLADFLPEVNDAWVNIIKTENQRFNVQDTYMSAIGEVVNYGNTVLGHSYNADLSFLEPHCPGIGCAAIYPISDNWRKSNLMMYYDVNYAELESRDDFDQEIIAAIEPEMTGSGSESTQSFGATEMKEHRETNVPFGKVRCYDFFIPSLYAKGKDGAIFTARNVYLTCLLKPNLRSEAGIEQRDIYVLKATEGVSPVDHGILFGSFTTNMPKVFYQQGPLQPFLPHQYTANQFFSEISRSTAMVTDPPKTITAANGGMLDPEETPIVDLESGASYDNIKIDLILEPGQISTALNTSLAYMNYFDRVFEEGVGVDKGKTGSMHQGRKTATEIKESYSGGQLNLVDAAGHFDRHILRPSISNRITGQQKLLVEQVEGIEAEMLEGELADNSLFRRLMNFSGIEDSYNQFYLRKMDEFYDDQEIFLQVERMAKQVESLIMFADSPVPPPPLVPQAEDAEGNVFPTANEIKLLQQSYFQEEQAKRDQAREQAKDIEIEMKRKELMFKDIKQPPEPSLTLYYQLLTAPVEDSDIVVTGAMSTVSKELARQNLVLMLSNLSGFPMEALEKIDFDGILHLLARANDIPLRDLLKDQSEVIREQEQRKKQEQMEQELIMRASQGKPGSQPPQFN